MKVKTYTKKVFKVNVKRVGQYCLGLYSDYCGVENEVDLNEILEPFVGSTIKITIEEEEGEE